MPKLKQSEMELRQKEIKCRLSDLMLRTGYDNTQLSKLLGITVQTLCTRKRRPETFTLREIWLIEKTTGCNFTIPLNRTSI